VVGVVVALIISLGWAALSPRVGPIVGLMDTPGSDALKVHKRPTPLLGGIGVFVGVHVGLFIEGAFDPTLLLATTVVLVLGVFDDRFGASPRTRLGVEFIAAALLIGLADTGLDTPIGFAFGVLFVVVAINAVNLLDGVDGLVGSVTLVSGLGLAWAGSAGFGDTSYGFVLAAAVAGFLVVNWNPARVFLGDNGAYTIGMFLAYGVLRTSSEGIGVMALVAMGVMGVFFIDLGATILRRAVNHDSLFSGDRGHVYDQLRNRGWSVRGVAAFGAVSQAVLVAVFVGMAVAGVAGISVAVIAIGVGGLACVALLWRLGFLAPLAG